MNTVLVVSYHKVLRTRKFCKYLPTFGFDPIVLTEEREGLSDGHRDADNLDLKSSKIVRASNTLHLERILMTFRFGLNYRFVCLPDPFIGWIPNAFVKGLELCRSHDIDLIYASGWPFSAMIVGYLLKRRTRIPLIVDFRDPWTLLEDPLMRYPSRFHRGLDQYIERRVMRESEDIITTTRAVAQDYSMMYPELRHKITTICNGFDSTDFKRQRAQFERFTITYTGSLYGSGNRPYRLFLEALSDSINSGAIQKEEIHVFFAGSKNPRVLRDIERYNLQTTVTATERVPYEQALWYAASSSLLLVIETTNAAPTKVYEYLATGVPILAIVREGELAKLIRKHSKHSYVTTSNSVAEVSDYTNSAYRRWKGGEVPVDVSGLKKYCDRFERKNLTKELAAVFTSAIGK